MPSRRIRDRRRRPALALLTLATLAACGPAAMPRAATPSSLPVASPTIGATPPLSLAPEPELTGVVATYRGDAARTGRMPGPGPLGRPRVAWTAQLDGPIRSSPVVRAGVVFVASGDGVIHAFGLASGEELWRVDVGAGVVASPLLIDDLLVVGDELGTVHALAVRDGSARWTAATDGGQIGGSPAAIAGRIVVATGRGGVVALQPDTGATTWTATVGSGVRRSVAASGELAYVGAGGELIALQVGDGAIAWRVRLASSGDVGTPAVGGGLVLAATGIDGSRTDLGVTAVDAATGKERWRYSSPAGAQVYTPALDGERAFAVGHDRSLVALDLATGVVTWSTDHPSDIEALPVLVDGVVFLAGNDGPLEAVDAATGKVRWSVPLEGIPFSPAVVDGRVVVGTDLGQVSVIMGDR